MKNLLLISSLLLALFLAPKAVAESRHTFRVMIIDTGLNAKYKSKTHLCENGHKDFTPDNNPFKDTNGHGTNISGIIERYAKGADYCQIIVKFYDASATDATNVANMIKAIKYASTLVVDYVNISGGGGVPEVDEKLAIKKLLDSNVNVVAAAGNYNTNLDKDCNYYPACYDKRIIVVENMSKPGVRSPSSNYGKIVTYKVIGENVCANDICLTGTSQATAKVTGKLIRLSYFH